MAEIGSWIGDKYRILRCLGKGGSSRVYLAEDRKLHLCWAVKEIEANDTFASHTKGVWNEIEILKGLQHPQIPRVVDVISQQACFFVVMDYVAGRSLQEICEEERLIRVDQVLDWGIQICEILEYLHAQEPPVVYRDLKPEHLIVQENGRLKLIDFGIARRYKKQNDRDTVVLGTAKYASPEQCMGNQTDPRSDLYSLGVTLFWIWKRRFPWEQRNVFAEARYEDLRLSYILARCMRHRVGRRYPSSKIVRRRLQHLQAKRYKERPVRMCLRLVLLAVGFSVLIPALYQIVQRNGMGIIEKNGFMMACDRQEAREELLKAAKRIPDEQEQKSIVEQYVSDYPADKSGYERLFEVWQKDGMLDEMERQEMERLIYEQEQQLKDAGLYGEVLFQMGRTYWYYYQNEQAELMNLQGISAGKTWFEESQEYLTDDTKLALAICYAQIGEFYEQIGSLSAQGVEGDFYICLWKKLQEMGELVEEDISAEHAIIQLEYACLAVSAAESYGVIWQEMGVSEEELTVLKGQVENICEKTTENGKRVLRMKAYIENCLKRI